MRNTFFALAVVALHIISIHSLQAQCVTFTHNEHKGFQNNVEEPYVNFTGLTFNFPAADGNKSDWLKDGNTVSYSGELSTNSEEPTMAIQRYNHGSWYGVLFDWFTLNYTAPEYSRIVYTLNYNMEIWKDYGEASIRAAYFDFGTDPNGYWAGRENDPLGYGNFSTSCRDDFGSGTESPFYTTRQGEDAAIWAHTGYVQEFVSPNHAMEVTVDNRNGNDPIEATRYSGFSSAKSNTYKDRTLNHYTRLRMWYTCEMYYYAQITYHANIPDVADQTQAQTLENEGMLFGADAFTYAGHHIVGWTTQADGGGSYSPNAGLTINVDNKGTIDLYAVWAADEEATELAITTAPAKTTYTAGERFDATGMVVTATVGGTPSTVVGYTITPSGALTAGTTSVTIAYGGQSTTQAITVNAAPAHTVTFGENITVSPATTSGSQVAEGTELTFTAANRTGYEFVGFYSDNDFGNKITSANPYTTTVADANITVYAKYMATTKTYTRENLTVGKIGTICLGYASIATSGAKFYELNYYDQAKGRLYLNDATQLVAGRPYLFEATAETLTITYDGKAEVVEAGNHNGLYGTYDRIEVTSDASHSYAAIKDNQVKVANQGVKITIPFDCAYILMDDIHTTEQPHAAPLRHLNVPRQTTTGLEQSADNNQPAADKLIRNGQLIIVREGKEYNVLGY